MKEQLLGLIGKPVKHSFSKEYFTAKFKRLHLLNYRYELFELSQIEDLKLLLKREPHLIGLNVTIPYKKAVIPYLSNISKEARIIGAVNTIKVESSGSLSGYNTDYYGFKTSLIRWLPRQMPEQALVLGSGGAASAVIVALRDIGITPQIISRNPLGKAISYDQLKNRDLQSYALIVNTTPLGMDPHPESHPDVLYDHINEGHFVYDLVYNPATTTFMQKAQERGAQVKGGLEMLQLQAEKAWEIWSE